MKKNRALWVGISVMFLAFLLFILINIRLENEFFGESFIPSIGVSLFSGFFAFLFLKLRWKTAATIYFIAIGLGFLFALAELFQPGNGDGLSGLIAFLVPSAFSLIVAPVAQAVILLVRAIRKPSS